MKYRLPLTYSLFLVALPGVAQVSQLPTPLVHICRPELEANAKCMRGEAGLRLLRGSQLSVASALSRLTAKATVADISKIVGTAPVEISAAGQAMLGGKLITRRIARWNVAWDSNLGKTEDSDRALFAVFANDLLMNVQSGGASISRIGVFYAAMECEPDCMGKLSPVPGR